MLPVNNVSADFNDVIETGHADNFGCLPLPHKMGYNLGMAKATKPTLIQSTPSGVEYAQTYVDGWPLHERPSRRRMTLLLVVQTPMPLTDVCRAVRQELGWMPDDLLVAQDIAFCEAHGYLRVWQ